MAKQKKKTAAELRAELEEAERIEAEDAAQAARIAALPSATESEPAEASHLLLVERDRLKKENEELQRKIEAFHPVFLPEHPQQAEPPIPAALIQPQVQPSPTPSHPRTGFSKGQMWMGFAAGWLVGIIGTLATLMLLAGTAG